MLNELFKKFFIGVKTKAGAAARRQRYAQHCGQERRRPA
jgi:hypothetical protein